MVAHLIPEPLQQHLKGFWVHGAFRSCQQRKQIVNRVVKVRCTAGAHRLSQHIAHLTHTYPLAVSSNFGWINAKPFWCSTQHARLAQVDALRIGLFCIQQGDALGLYRGRRLEQHVQVVGYVHAFFGKHGQVFFVAALALYCVANARSPGVLVLVKGDLGFLREGVGVALRRNRRCRDVPRHGTLVRAHLWMAVCSTV